MRPTQKQVKKGVRHVAHPLPGNHHNQGLHGNVKHHQNAPESATSAKPGQGISEVPAAAEPQNPLVSQEDDPQSVPQTRKSTLCKEDEEPFSFEEPLCQAPTEKVALTLEEAKSVLGECSRMGNMLNTIFGDFLCVSPAAAGKEDADESSMDSETGPDACSTVSSNANSSSSSGKDTKVNISAHEDHPVVCSVTDEASASRVNHVAPSSLTSDAKKEGERTGGTTKTCQGGKGSPAGEAIPKDEAPFSTNLENADSSVVTIQADWEDQKRQMSKTDATGGAKNSSLINELLKCQATCEEVAMKMLNQYIQAEKEDAQEHKTLTDLHLRPGHDLPVSGSKLQLDSDVLTAACGDLLDSRQMIQNTFQQISAENNAATEDRSDARLSYLRPTKSVQNRLRHTPEKLEDKERLAKMHWRQSFLRNPRLDPNAAPKGQCPFKVEPDAAVSGDASQVIFHGFRIGSTYKQTIIFRNTSKLGRRLRVELAVPQKDIRLSPLDYKSLPLPRRQTAVSAEDASTCTAKGKASALSSLVHHTGTIAPGLSAQVEIQFQPTSFEDITTQLLMHTDVGSFSIAVLCRRELAELPTLPPVVDCGIRMVGEAVEVSERAGVFEDTFVVQSDSGQAWPVRTCASATSSRIELVQFDNQPWTMQRLFDAVDWGGKETNREPAFEFPKSNRKDEQEEGRWHSEAQDDIASRALPKRIDFGDVQADGGVAERTLLLRNGGQLPVKLRWRLRPGHAREETRAHGANQRSHFSLDPMNVELAPGATQEFVFSFKPYTEGLERIQVEATAELEVRGLAFCPRSVATFVCAREWHSSHHIL
uniref:Uncharacterized protein n=1 Tax=Neospora caninum (strain Liverpool) TaxID=572307 RepID=A0A0F7UR70_NEOCL|nr:TPA: hypothetical protein BN1204_062660 [Neospora caninum Liverpool]